MAAQVPKVIKDKSTSRYNYRPGFEGGQMPLQRRVPKFGFKNLNRIEYNVINLDTLQELASNFAGQEINHDFFRTTWDYLQ